MKDKYADYPCGGFALFRKNIISPSQLKGFTESLHALSSCAPMLGIDEEGGRIARIANHPANFNVIIPEVQRSWYADMAYGIDYFRYIAEELPDMMSRMFRIPVDRDHLFAAGLSMGGYGAMKCALTYPDRYAGAMSFSGALSILEHPEAMQAIMSREEIAGILGADLRCGDGLSIAKLAQKAAAVPEKPRLYIACGTEDALIADNRNMAALVRDLGFDTAYEEWPGHHDWEFWDSQIKKVIDWL